MAIKTSPGGPLLLPKLVPPGLILGGTDFAVTGPLFSAQQRRAATAGYPERSQRECYNYYG